MFLPEPLGKKKTGQRCRCILSQSCKPLRPSNCAYSRNEWHRLCLDACMRRLLFCLFCGAIGLLCCRAGAAAVAEFPIAVREGMLWVEVRIPETQRKLELLLDSGAEASVLDLQTAKDIGLTLGAPVGVRGVHASTEGYWCGTRGAEANGVELPNRFLALDLNRLSGSCGRKVDGLIGADFFKNKIVQLDFNRASVGLTLKF